ncbi:chlorophyll synthesis pathway protein BchC [Sphingomonas sp. ASV193]|uniref:chlorophyll synthesis pathway protein BchC n=1 Tax=Sphingomonas sp. ASV193 TaxID=3144405 RepID=UPI0032E89CF9
MDSLAVILDAPGRLSIRALELVSGGADDVTVEIRWSGISTGTEKLLWTGEMPPFPGMGYPLVPGYESVGRIVDAGANARGRIGEWVFVPGANCYRDARGLFGGTAERLVVASARAIAIPEALGSDGVLLALAATAHHALVAGPLPELVVGHGVLGRLIARLAIALGGEAPIVWETRAARRTGAAGYRVAAPKDDDRRDYRAICDVSGDPDALDGLIERLAPGGEIALAGFYARPLHFAFPAAFRKEARLRVAAEFKPADLAAVAALVEAGTLDLGGLVSDVSPAWDAGHAYPAAFDSPDCLKMVLDWSDAA